MPYISTGEAARALGVDIRSLQRWVERGEIEPDFVTPGGHYRWDVERVRAELYQRLRQKRTQREPRPQGEPRPPREQHPQREQRPQHDP